MIGLLHIDTPHGRTLVTPAELAASERKRRRRQDRDIARPGTGVARRDVWRRHRKLALLAEIDAGRLGLDEACARYGVGARQVERWRETAGRAEC